jgi:hypothetical protein
MHPDGPDRLELDLFETRKLFRTNDFYTSRMLKIDCEAPPGGTAQRDKGERTDDRKQARRREDKDHAVIPDLIRDLYGLNVPWCTDSSTVPRDPGLRRDDGTKENPTRKVTTFFQDSTKSLSSNRVSSNFQGVPVA